MQKTIAIFSGFYLPHLGGIERYIRNVVKHLVPLGYRIVIVTSQDEPELPLHEVDGPVSIYRLPTLRFWHSRYPIPKKNRVYREQIREIIDEKADFYICNTRFQLPSIIGARLAKKSGKEALVIEHGAGYLTFGNSVADVFLHAIEHILIARVKKLSNVFYGVSQEGADWLATFGIKARGVLYNAVNLMDYERFSVEKDSSVVTIFFAGRLQPNFKGIETLLKAFCSLEKDFHQIRLVFAGDGPLYEKLSGQYSRKNISFLGNLPHDEVMKWHSRADIFVLLSKIEGFSTVLLEAGLMETALVTTNVGGAKEIIPDDRYGRIIENDEESLEICLRELILDASLRENMQKLVSRRTRENFTWDKTISQLELAIRNIYHA